MNRKGEFQRGAIAAASVADTYNSTTTHVYRLGDCVLAKLNIGKRKPRANRACLTDDINDAWVLGFAAALAELHRGLLHGNDSAGVCKVARGAGVTIKIASAAGVSAYDLVELKKAGVR